MSHAERVIRNRERARCRKTRMLIERVAAHIDLQKLAKAKAV